MALRDQLRSSLPYLLADHNSLMSSELRRQELERFVSENLTKANEDREQVQDLSKGMNNEEFWELFQSQLYVLPESYQTALKMQKDMILEMRMKTESDSERELRVKSSTDRLFPLLMEYRAEHGIDGPVDKGQFMAVVSICAARGKLKAKAECIRELETVPEGLRKEMLTDLLKLFDDNDS